MFDPMYIQGYTAALLDVLDVFAYIQEDLKLHKRRQSAKTYQAIVQCMLQNRAALREDPDTFIRCNDNIEGGFELWGNYKRSTEHTEVTS